MKLSTEKTIIKSRLVFNQFRITDYSDGTCRYENYPYYFDTVIKALSWGRAYDNAQKELMETQNHIKDLLEQVEGK